MQMKKRVVLLGLVASLPFRRLSNVYKIDKFLFKL